MRLLLKIIFIALALFSVERLCHRATDGFAMVNVFPPPGDNSSWQRTESLALTSNTFTYYASGSQCYVFLSEDGKSVLKLFKFQHMRTPPWLNTLPLSGLLRAKRAKKRQILERTFNSLSLAYDLFREESALIFLHLDRTTHLKSQVTLIDKIGKRHSLDLDSLPFLIQKKGELAYTSFDRWMERGEVEKVKRGIRELLTLALSRCKAGIFDKDPDFSTNFGFIDTTPFQIDFGRFTLDQSEKEPRVHRPEMVRITRNFHRWIEKNHPDLLDYFEKELLAIIE
ncbi:MAG: hypothetical protein K1060chlam2_00961 [Chlamydiae bacterium]|nr:hypothetical protein [Chlamydiota bacterium]